jgi:hypothetical protein
LSFSVIACDGIADTCPATLKPGGVFCGGPFNPGVTVKDVAACIQLNSPNSENTSSCSYSKSTNVFCGYDSEYKPVYATRTDSNVCAATGPNSFTMTQKASGFCGQPSQELLVGDYQLSPGNYYACDNPQYPTGPNAQNLCIKSPCSALKNVSVGGDDDGYTFTSNSISTTACINVGLAKCKIVFGGQPGFVASSCVVSGGQNTCFHDVGTYTGGSCDEAPTPPNPPQHCATASDGRQICVPADQGSGTNCVTNQYGEQKCVSQTPPTQACTANPTAPECQNPQQSNCGFVNGVFQCVTSQQNCGNFNGQNVCINPDGSVSNWDGNSQGTDNGTPGGAGSGTGTPGGGTTGSPTFEDKPDLDVNNNTGDRPTLETPENIEGWDDFKNALNEDAPSDVKNLFGGITNPFAGLTGVPCCTVSFDFGKYFGLVSWSAPEWLFAGVRWLVTMMLSIAALNRIIKRVQEVF